MRPILDAAGCLCVYLLSPTGGVVQGDRYALSLDIQEKAHALFTTQSATKVYRMPDGCAEQITHVEVGRDAIFEYVPDAAILFADSDYQQRLDVQLQPGALAFLSEIILPGRAARGERFRFRRYANRTIVRDPDGLILFESAAVCPHDVNLDVLGRMEGFTCWGNAYLVGDLAKRGIDVVSIGERYAGLLERLQQDRGLGGISTLRRNGLVIKVISDRLETIYALFNDFRAHLRTAYLGLPAAPLRK